jgi:hypothetical protein
MEVEANLDTAHRAGINYRELVFSLKDIPVGRAWRDRNDGDE